MSVKKFKPLSNRMVVKRAETEKSHGGILLPESAQETPKLGEVIAVGPGKMDDDGALSPMDVKVGDKVVFSSFSGNELSVEEEGSYLVISEDDVLAIVG